MLYSHKIFLIQVMKAVAVILLLAVCGTASANTNMMPKQLQCAVADPSFPTEVASRCNGVSGTVACSNNPDSCASYICNYYNNNNFPSSCTTPTSDVCRNAGLPVPSACGGNPSTSTSTPSTGTPSTSGAAALSAIKGLLVAVLLLAALIVA